MSEIDMADDVHVHGAATPEEIAAVVAALRMRDSHETRLTRYERWRRERRAVLRDNR